LFINGYSNGFGDIDSSYVGLTSDCWIPYFGFTWREAVDEDWLDEIDYNYNWYDAHFDKIVWREQNYDWGSEHYQF
jgi:hypothetical protein